MEAKRGCPLLPTGNSLLRRDPGLPRGCGPLGTASPQAAGRRGTCLFRHQKWGLPEGARGARCRFGPWRRWLCWAARALRPSTSLLPSRAVPHLHPTPSRGPDPCAGGAGAQQVSAAGLETPSGLAAAALTSVLTVRGQRGPGRNPHEHHGRKGKGRVGWEGNLPSGWGSPGCRGIKQPWVSGTGALCRPPSSAGSSGVPLPSASIAKGEGCGREKRKSAWAGGEAGAGIVPHRWTWIAAGFLPGFC